jgi:acetyltransferase
MERRTRGGQTKLARVAGEILPDNREMQRVCEKLGFRLERPIEEPTVRAVIDLTT